ncbi:glycosyltransferase [Mucilaginibacter mali]|uniref:Glycosyltransferase n=1 Tax=Mucilaginibacter mali TaxID=2740462 RepID=A0A7D4UC42_9SPHI|nr:glycosyltransferase [Mucilaginibacter mali]QKJ31478.1 glycosyltransferase [Mucilaginibacter mali]
MFIKKRKDRISLLYSGHQFDYLYGILSGLYKTRAYHIDIIDSDRPAGEKHGFYDSPNFHFKPFLRKVSKQKIGKASRWVWYYFKLIPYLCFNRSSIIHIEWLNSQFVGFEELILPFIIKKVRRQMLVYKVHDISSRLLLNSSGKNYHVTLNFTKRYFYNNVDIFIVHNNFTKGLLTDLGIPAQKIKIISHGVNNFVPFAHKTKNSARMQLGLKATDKIVLFFGNISPYKNIEVLIDAVAELSRTDNNIKLLIAGNFRKGLNEYRAEISDKLNDDSIKASVSLHLEFISNQEIETFFAAADVLCLPYKFIFQSGVLFLAYRLGTFVIAPQTGGIPEDILEGETGLTYDKDEDLLKTLDLYFRSGKYNDAELGEKIRRHADENYSWEKITGQLFIIYDELVQNL